jgi:hypothetical protein
MCHTSPQLLIAWSLAVAAMAGGVPGCSNNPPPTAADDAGAFDAGGPIGDGGIAECYETLGEGTGCVSCLSVDCGPLWSAAQTSCGAYLACVCPGGIYDASAAKSSTCVSDLQGACATASDSLTSCEVTLCPEACQVPLDAGGAEPTCTGAMPCGTMGQTIQICTATSFCYAQVGSDDFACASCSDTTGCVQAATAACPMTDD